MSNEMTDFNYQPTDSLAWLSKGLQDIPYNGDLVEMKHYLKDLRSKVDQTYCLVDTEIDNGRRTRGKNHER